MNFASKQHKRPAFYSPDRKKNIQVEHTFPKPSLIYHLDSPLSPLNKSFFMNLRPLFSKTKHTKFIRSFSNEHFDITKYKDNKLFERKLLDIKEECNNELAILLKVLTERCLESRNPEILNQSVYII